MEKRPRNSGVALIITLLVITIAGTALAAAAGRSCRTALEASEAMEDLQIRWGTLSCRDLAMSSAEWMLVSETQDNGSANSTTRKSVTLGSITFDLVFSDEQAKANVNVLAQRRNAPDLAHAMTNIQLDLNRICPVNLKPARTDPKRPDQSPYLSFGQIFEAARPQDLISNDPLVESAGDRITCWSNGKVNFKRADRAVLREMLSRLLNEGQIDKLLKYRDKSPDCTLLEAISSIELSDRDEMTGRIMNLLTDMSLCHGLWVIARGRTRSWFSFHVRRVSDQRQWSFQW